MGCAVLSRVLRSGGVSGRPPQRVRFLRRAPCHSVAGSPGINSCLQEEEDIELFKFVFTPVLVKILDVGPDVMQSGFGVIFLFWSGEF